MSVSKFIDKINEGLPKISGKVYGLASSVVRTRGTLIELLPGIIDDNGEVFYVGLDDTQPLIIYHKSNSISVTRQPGMGNDNDVINTYSNSIVIYNDRKRTGMLPDEIVEFLQSNFPETFVMEPYKTISVRFANVVLNDQVVFANEYQNTDFKLPPGKNLILANYIIESTFKKRCFVKCPLTI